MGLFNKIKRAWKLRNYSLADFERTFNDFFYGQKYKPKSGVCINEESAKTFSAVYACIRNISEDIGLIPIEIRRWRDVSNHSKGSDLVYDHPLHDLLQNTPDGIITAMNFEESMQNHLLSSGNAYAYKIIDGRGRISGLKLMNWQLMEPEVNKNTGNLEYIFNDRGKNVTFRYDEIFHIAGLGFDGIKGYSPIAMAMQAIGLGLGAEEFASYFYSNGANIGGFIEMPGAVNDPEAMRKEFTEKWGGLKNSHKVIFLEEGMKFQKLVMPLHEAQFLEMRLFQKQEIATFYRMPLHMVGDLTRSTFSNIEHQDLEYVKHTLLPWVVRWENTGRTRLLTRRERQQGYFIQHKIDELLRGDSKTRADVNHIKRQDGIISADEWRAEDNQNPQEGKYGNTYFINSTMTTIENAAMKKVDSNVSNDNNQSDEQQKGDDAIDDSRDKGADSQR